MLSVSLSGCGEIFYTMSDESCEERGMQLAAFTEEQPNVTSVKFIQSIADPTGDRHCTVGIEVTMPADVPGSGMTYLHDSIYRAMDDARVFTPQSEVNINVGDCVVAVNWLILPEDPAPSCAAEPTPIPTESTQ
ncbi:hypothetical protein ACEXQD_17435 [Herbiconiux sp. P15]|uniref:hypothetical protein n=1 Tax=Herbiconiux liukaitaii TaxID=3342799 RepID=UPI0035BB3748